MTQFPFGRTGTCGGGIGEGEEAAETREEEDGQRPEKNILIMIMIMVMIIAVMMIVKTRPSKLCEFCINSYAERRKMTAVNWVN